MVPLSFPFFSSSSSPVITFLFDVLVNINPSSLGHRDASNARFAHGILSCKIPRGLNCLVIDLDFCVTSNSLLSLFLNFSYSQELLSGVERDNNLRSRVQLNHVTHDVEFNNVDYTSFLFLASQLLFLFLLAHFHF